MGLPPSTSTSRWVAVAVFFILIICALIIFGKAKREGAVSPTEKLGGSMFKEDSLTPKTVAVLNPLENSGQKGAVAFVEEKGNVKVTLNLTGAQAFAQPAHIHRGACPNPGAVKYNLADVVGGKSETVLALTLAQLEQELPLAVNVHKSADDLKSYTACGDVQASVPLLKKYE